MRLLQVCEYGWGDSAEFQSRLLPSWGLPLEAYQALEVVFRQALLTRGYSYAFDYADPALSLGEAEGAKAYLERISAYLRQYEKNKQERYEAVQALHRKVRKENSWAQYFPEVGQWMKTMGADRVDSPALLVRRLTDNDRYVPPSTMLEYGFEEFYFRKDFDDQLALHGVSQQGNDTDQETLLKRFIEKISVHGRAPGKYLQRAETLEQVRLKVKNHEFFRNYVAIAWSVFYPIFTRAKGDVGHRFYQFLSHKMATTIKINETPGREQAASLEDIFTAEILSDRIAKNKKYAENISAELTDLGLIGKSFFDLVEEKF